MRVEIEHRLIEDFEPGFPMRKCYEDDIGELEKAMEDPSAKALIQVAMPEMIALSRLATFGMKERITFCSGQRALLYAATVTAEVERKGLRGFLIKLVSGNIATTAQLSDIIKPSPGFSRPSQYARGIRNITESMLKVHNPNPIRIITYNSSWDDTTKAYINKAFQDYVSQNKCRIEDCHNS